jgi:hypothetical protein
VAGANYLWLEDGELSCSLRLTVVGRRSSMRRRRHLVAEQELGYRLRKHAVVRYAALIFCRDRAFGSNGVRLEPGRGILEQAPRESALRRHNRVRSVNVMPRRGMVGARAWFRSPAAIREFGRGAKVKDTKC